MWPSKTVAGPHYINWIIKLIASDASKNWFALPFVSTSKTLSTASRCSARKFWSTFW